MEAFNQIQKRFLDEIRKGIPDNISFAELIADDLDISNDSAYRRIRGDTHLTFDECRILCTKYGISLDSFFVNSNDYVLFNYRAIDTETFDFGKYFMSILENLEAIKRFEAKELIYAAKDIPPFHLFMFDRLAAFKLFFWMSNIFHFKDYENKNFGFDTIPSESLTLAKKVWESYISIPSTEIWSEETINATLRQIEFFYECGKFESKEIALQLLNDLKDVVIHLQKQAKRGYKFLYGKDDAKGNEGNYQLYYNEILIVDSTIFFKMGDMKMVLLGNNVMNILSTSDPLFCDHTKNILNNIIRNSTLISVVGEKVRKKFFHRLIHKVEEFKIRIEEGESY